MINRALASLAAFIVDHPGEDFISVWNAWVPEYRPDKKLIPTLLAFGQRLSEIDPKFVKEVQEGS